MATTQWGMSRCTTHMCCLHNSSRNTQVRGRTTVWMNTKGASSLRCRAAVAGAVGRGVVALALLQLLGASPAAGRMRGRRGKTGRAKGKGKRQGQGKRKQEGEAGAAAAGAAAAGAGAEGEGEDVDVGVGGPLSSTQTKGKGLLLVVRWRGK